jgi:hypothetical protein
VNKIVGEAQRLGLLTQQHYLRPAQKGQGASNYYFDLGLFGCNRTSHLDGENDVHTSQGGNVGDTDNGSLNERSAAAASCDLEPPDFSALAQPIDDLVGRRRALVLDAWRSEPDLVRAHILDVASRSNIRASRAGLLVHLLESGDVPRQTIAGADHERLRSAVCAWARNVGTHYDERAVDEELAKWEARGADSATLDEARVIASGGCGALSDDLVSGGSRSFNDGASRLSGLEDAPGEACA